jgi:hypothetical protein
MGENNTLGQKRRLGYALVVLLDDDLLRFLRSSVIKNDRPCQRMPLGVPYPCFHSSDLVTI